MKWLDNYIAWIVLAVLGTSYLLWGLGKIEEPLLRGLSSGISIPIHFSLSTTNQFNRLATTTALSLLDDDWRLAIGTTTSQYPVGDSSLVVYGTTTLQAKENTDYLFRILNAASTTVLTFSSISNSLGIGTATPYRTFGFVGDGVFSSAGTSTLTIESTAANRGGCLEFQDQDTKGWIRLYAGSAATTSGQFGVVSAGGRGLVVEIGKCDN